MLCARVRACDAPRSSVFVVIARFRTAFVLRTEYGGRESRECATVATQTESTDYSAIARRYAS